MSEIDFNNIDFRTPAEKERELLYKKQGEEFLRLLKLPGATKQRAINYLCQHYGVSEMTMRSHLYKSGLYEFSPRYRKDDKH